MADDKSLESLLGTVDNVDIDSLDTTSVYDADLKNLLGDIISEAKSIEDIESIDIGDVGLSPEELDRISAMDVSSEVVEMDNIDESEKKKGKKEKAKKEKVKKEKKSKKKKSKEAEEVDGEEAVEAPQKDKKEKKKSKKEKEKKSVKKVISDMLFEDVEEESVAASDVNSQILDEMYPEEQKGKKGKKKEKAKKEKKPKKPKKERVKKEKEPVDPNDKVAFSPIKIVFFLTFVVAIIMLVLVWTDAFNYYNNMKDAKAYYNKGNYAMAYESISGMEIKDKDAKFYQQTRQIMLIEKQRNSYFKYVTLGDNLRALESLLKGIKIHGENSENDKKLGVYEVTSGVYIEIVELLQEEFDISEEDAVYYANIENYSQLYEILKIYSQNKK